ncbi:SDR family NAD(P)-dependent oxidoreductase [Alloalcanivorax mobilis]|uniref:SDR family NAD(P)-dependent oxidoreductase n=1 Tax=Alloalcanivorax mobilis TaxID=2019569 RepID=UPI000C7952AA|nr:SDR family oxidoreductase [Alloalcanivorax mobilis]|tara:strand:- start:31618 stop:32358 length:741 start_codon:yes stop_codon:yes gene_type:complete
MVSNRFQGQRALVTGGAKGIGAGIAERLAGEGAAVVIADIDEAAGRPLAERLGSVFLELDLTNTAAVEHALVDEPPFQILINNAGMDQHAWFTETSPAQWQALLAVNLTAVLAVTRAVLPAMQSAGYGRLVHIASEAARLGSAGGAVYAASKGAVLAFSRSMARENARYGITSNVIAPGPVETPMLKEALVDGGDKLYRAMVGATLVGRLGRVDEIAAAVAFVASDEAGFITGEVLGVSGGMGCGQ